MIRAGLIFAVASTLAACSAERRPDVPVGENFPPVGLASSAVWLENRKALAPAARLGAEQARQASVPDARLNAPSARASAAVAVPERAAPTSTIDRARVAFADICVASMSDVNRLGQRARRVNLRDFGAPVRSLDTDANEDYTLGGARRDGVGIITTVNFGRSQTTQCVVSVFREDNSAAAQAMVDTIAAAGFGLTPISARNRAQQSWSISGAPAGTTVNVSSRSSRSVGVWIAWP